MNRREASKEETRALILEAARRLLVKKGGQDSTVREIAKEAGVSPATVVVHFKTKVALMEEALYEDIEAHLNKLKDSMPQTGSLLERLLHFPYGFLEFYSRNRELYMALIKNTMFEPLEETPRMSKQVEQYIYYIAGILEEGKARGYLEPETDLNIASAALFSMYMGALTTMFRYPSIPLETINHGLAAMFYQFLSGIKMEGK